jgi:hypothetical protein
MFILMPTHEKYVPVAQISLALLDRYWPNHPPVEVALDAGGEGWIATVIRALKAQDDPLFILMLDDFGLCAPARGKRIAVGAAALGRDEWPGMVSLCWYPAKHRMHYHGSPEWVELQGAPMLLQAAIWRRSWFLELAEQMDPRTSVWGFERQATQIIKRKPRGMLVADFPTPTWIGGRVVDGYDKSNWPLPYHNLMHRDQPALEYEPFLHAHGLRFPSRGLGDTIARLAHATGIDRVMPAGCGCAERREKLNGAVPYG